MYDISVGRRSRVEKWQHSQYVTRHCFTLAFFRFLLVTTYNYSLTAYITPPVVTRLVRLEIMQTLAQGIASRLGIPK